MSTTPGKHPVAIVTACMSANGTPTFVLTNVEVTPQEAENGVHYGLAEADLLQAGYEEPFVHFDEGESPTFLHPAVRQHLGLSPDVNHPTTPFIVEVRQ
jgi:hypothetical protein